MIELQTGLPGSGKTLYTICRIKARAEAESRPVYYSGIPDLNLPWIEIEDPRQWHTVPPNAIVVIDEAQRVFRPRGNGSAVPEHVEKLETHRHQGIDLVIITQHPMLIDSNVRRLVGKHYHVARAFGKQKALVLEYESAKDNPLAARQSALTRDFSYPSEAFAWYKSAEVHTHKKRVPLRVYALYVTPVIALALFGYLAWWIYGKASGTHPLNETAHLPAQSAPAPGISGGATRPVKRTTAEYIQEQQPRIPGLAYSAPIYDEVTKPVHAPYPAACVVLRGECRCYSQQGTRLPMDKPMCENIVREGFFIAWDTRGPQEREGRQRDRQPLQPTTIASIASTASVPSAESRTTSGIAIEAPPRPEPLSSTPSSNPIQQQPYQPRVPASSPWSAVQ